MPLLEPATALTDAQLEKMITDHARGLEALVARMEDPSFSAHEPLPIRTAVDLGRDVLALIAELRGDRADRAVKVALVNVAYSTMMAMIDVMKMHSDLPKVPKG